jgi:hypothetical protein
VQNQADLSKPVNEFEAGARECSFAGETKLMGVAIDLKSGKQLTIFVIDSLSAFSYDELRLRVRSFENAL